MREILFKAKRSDNDEWVEGYYINTILGQLSRPCIIPYGKLIEIFNNNIYQIDPFSVCQYTGLDDKNGKKIWENDICIIHNGYIDEEDGYFAVKWDDNEARFVLGGNGLTADFDCIFGYECEVVGNAFDNPELLEWEEEEG